MAEDIRIRFGKRLGNFKKKANISFAKIHYATAISENHIKNTVIGKVNIGLNHLGLYAKLFGMKDHQMLDYDSPIPDRITLQKNISKYFIETGFKASNNFKKAGPSYLVEEYMMDCDEFPEALEASQIRDKINEANGTHYKTNDVSRVLNKLAEEEIIVRVDTGNNKRPKYYKLKE